MQTRPRPGLPAYLNSLLGILELVGGAAGLLVTSLAVAHHPPLAASSGTYLGATLFVLVAAAGSLVLRGRRIGAVLSLWAQALQGLEIALGGFAYRFVAGPHLTLRLAGPRIWSPWGLESAFVGLLAPGLPPFELGVNLFAVAVAVYFAWLLRWTKHRPPAATS